MPTMPTMPTMPNVGASVTTIVDDIPVAGLVVMVMRASFVIASPTGDNYIIDQTDSYAIIPV